jgi:hypothetical protein
MRNPLTFCDVTINGAGLTNSDIYNEQRDGIISTWNIISASSLVPGRFTFTPDPTVSFVLPGSGGRFDLAGTKTDSVGAERFGHGFTGVWSHTGQYHQALGAIECGVLENIYKAGYHTAGSEKFIVLITSWRTASRVTGYSIGTS